MTTKQNVPAVRSSMYRPVQGAQSTFVQYIHQIPSIMSNVTSTSTTWTSPSMIGTNPNYTNLIIWQDAQDLYCNTVGHIKLTEGTDCKIELPDGTILYLDQDGKCNISSTDYPYIEKKNVVNDLKIKEGRECQIELPDGSYIIVDVNGNYYINDENAHKVYKANRILEFNRFINASDILEEFIGFVGSLGVSQSELMQLPIELFINFLILRAAEADGDSAPDIVLEQHPALLPARHRHNIHCRCCGKFVSKLKHDKGIDFCSQEHFLIYAEKQMVF